MNGLTGLFYQYGNPKGRELQIFVMNGYTDEEKPR